jgi:Ca2+-binding RTX toxin-like protein
MTHVLKRLALVAVVGATALLGGATAASATVEPPVVIGNTLTVSGDGAPDTITLAASGGVLTVNGAATTLAANANAQIVVGAGGGDDTVTASALAAGNYGSLAIDGGEGDDLITGGAGADELRGNSGNDRLIGFQGTDAVGGGDGDDVIVWNNGDGTDTNDGDAGTDEVEVNGAAAASDAVIFKPDAAVAGRVQFNRTNLVPFAINLSAERLTVNGLGGGDVVEPDPAAPTGVAGRTSLTLNGGTGDDALTGSDGADAINGGGGLDKLSGGASADLISGGDDADVLEGDGGDDRVVGDRGSDAMNGGAGDDTLVWNNGDGTDVLNGDDGRDDVEVNGATTAGDAFTVQPNGARIRFDRTNLVPFSLDIGSSETAHANGLGGDDAISVGEVGSFSVIASGGPDNDTLAGGGSSETLLGGSGNDTIAPGGGLDVVFGDEGDDRVNVRDDTADVARGGDGNDSVVADTPDLDILEGFERVDRPPVVNPAPVTRTRPLTIRGHMAKVTGGSALIKVSCPASSAANCTGSLAVRTAAAVKVAGLKAVLELGSARFDLAPGISRALKAKLAKGSRRLADRRGHLQVLAVASTGSQGQIAQSSRRLTLALRAATKRN